MTTESFENTKNTSVHREREREKREKDRQNLGTQVRCPEENGGKDTHTAHIQNAFFYPFISLSPRP
jgi:hypothetical protein